MEPESISKDDLDSLEFMIGQVEKAQYALQTFQQYIAQKYLRQGDAVKSNGEIVRAKVEPPSTLGKEVVEAITDELKNNGQLRQAVANAR